MPPILSLGGMMAPQIAVDNDVEGIIILAGNARPLEELILEQYSYLFGAGGISDEEQLQIDRLNQQLENLEIPRENQDDTTLDLPLGLPATYWMSLLTYDQQTVIKSVTSDVLVMQGERDYQVTMQDFELWKKALKPHERAQFISYPKLNHLFLEGTGPSHPGEYQIEATIPDYVIDDIATWIIKIN